MYRGKVGYVDPQREGVSLEVPHVLRESEAVWWCHAKNSFDVTGSARAGRASVVFCAVGKWMEGGRSAVLDA